jgi:hypothetical protein
VRGFSRDFHSDMSPQRLFYRLAFLSHLRWKAGTHFCYGATSIEWQVSHAETILT